MKIIRREGPSDEEIEAEKERKAAEFEQFQARSAEASQRVDAERRAAHTREVDDQRLITQLEVTHGKEIGDDTWQIEADNYPQLLRWRELHKGANTIEDPYYRLKANIHMLYEELYMNRDWESLGGFITHNSPNLSQGMIPRMAEKHGLQAEELAAIFAEYRAEYSEVGSSINLMINATPASTDMAQLEEYYAKLQSTRSNPRYDIFFRSHFFYKY